MAAAMKIINTDVFILGAGPAGLAAATSLSRQMIPTIIFDSGKYRNAPTSHMHNVIGFDHANPKDFRATSRRELTSRYKSNTFVERQVTKLTKGADGLFEATDAEGQRYSAKKVILATGVRDIFPEIEGYAEAWGSAVFHCLFCHGFEERGSRKAALLAQGPLTNPAHATAVSGMAQRMADEVVLYTNGDEQVKSSLETAISATILKAKVDSRKISRIEKFDMDSDERVAIHFEDGSKDTLGFMVHLPVYEVNVPKDWRDELGIELNETGDLKLDQMYQTTCPGIHAAGDHAGMLKAVPHALFTGSTAAAFVVHSLVLGH